MPLPTSLVVKKGSKIRGRTSGGMPGPFLLSGAVQEDLGVVVDGGCGRGRGDLLPLGRVAREAVRAEEDAHRPVRVLVHAHRRLDEVRSEAARR